MNLHSVLFREKRRGTDYDRLAAVLKLSARENSPATPLMLHVIEDDDADLKAKSKAVKATFVDNARKTRHHCQVVQDAQDGELIGLLDCDTMVLGDLSEIADMPFDLAYTARPEGSRYPFNTGVVFVRVNDHTRRFYRLWLEKVEALLANPVLLAKQRNKYGGINQCGLAATMEDFGSIDIRVLPCRIWNCENESWKLFDVDTKVAHIVPPLRRVCLTGRLSRENSRQRKPKECAIRDAWVRYDKQAKGRL